MRRAAIYARYSTDLQSDRSIEDQVALCREYAARQGLTVVGVYADRAMTSASLIGRDGFADLLAHAQADRFDVVVVEALDRISRDQEDLAGVHKRLTFLDIAIETCGGGTADMLQIGFHGLMGQIWMSEHRKKVHRGQAGVLRSGRHPGGRAYGYRPIEGKPGELRIEEGEAEIVRRIFERYVEGSSPRAIAGELNADGILPPRGATWNASTINGNHARGYGILANALYDGRLVWNRVRMVRDPDTGRRVSRVRPEEEWMRAPAEHLRIVPEALFTAAERRRLAQRIEGTKKMGRAAAKPLRPFSGLLRCGCCGSGMSIQTRRGSVIYIRCSRSSESGTCENRKRARLDLIESAVFGALREELANPAYVTEYLRAYHETRSREASAARKNKSALERRLTKARAAFKRAYDLYIHGVTDGPEAEANIADLQKSVRTAEDALAAATEEVPVVELHPGALDRYLSALEDLNSQDADQAVQLLRELIESVTVTQTGDGLDVTVSGYLAALLGHECRQLVVAEEGLEPPTRGL